MTSEGIALNIFTAFGMGWATHRPKFQASTEVPGKKRWRSKFAAEEAGEYLKLHGVIDL